MLTLFLGFIPTLVTAQTTATVNGIVQDAQGGAIPGATVTTTNLATSLVRTYVTDSQGRYTVSGLPPGAYELRAELTGFVMRPVRVTLAVAQTVAINLVLDVNLHEVVQVADSTPVVNTSSSELSYLVGSDTIDALPLNGRNYTDLALLQPGVVAYAHRDGGSVVAHGLAMSMNGQDPRSNVYLLDGTLLNDMTNGPAGSAAGTCCQSSRLDTRRVRPRWARVIATRIATATSARAPIGWAKPTVAYLGRTRPRRASSRPHDSPATPAPMMATVIPFGGGAVSRLVSPRKSEATRLR